MHRQFVVVNCSRAYKSYHIQQCLQKQLIAIMPTQIINIKSVLSFSSCDSSSISRNVGLPVCLSVCRSVRPQFVFIEVLCCWQCIYCVSIIVAQIIRSFCSHILQFQLRQQLYRSQCQSVCLSVRNEFYGSVMLLLVHLLLLLLQFRI